ncbi:MAG: glycosyltransferase [Oribacterium sp.]|nr:glycosyltransferase [Oribacterium sp.]MBP3296281.1 glycosyltransferase [Lachnospiraceae bacterium]
MPDVLKNGISMVLLSYKEEENLRVLLPQIKEKLEECGEPYEILVVDAMEELDNSRAVCEENGVRYLNEEEPCFGGAFRTGIRYARYQKFFIMDSDGSHNPRYIPDIYHIFVAERADVAIGSRYTKGGVNNDSILSRIMSHILNAVYGIVLGIRVKDMSTDFRMYHTCRLKEVEPELVCRHYDVLQEVLLKLKLKKQARGKKLKVVETPITFDKRLFGNSKRRLLAFIISYMKSVFYLGGMRIKAAGRH